MVNLRDWKFIRHNFSQAEKDSLNKAIIGEVLCPPGVYISLDKISNELHDKLVKLIEEERSGKKG